ncbi:eIF2A-domain-containing protein [Imleria badia]|nr:eIF2A-domain-containing protein [Imleria badia]
MRCRLFACALPTTVRIFHAEGAKLFQSIPNIIESQFSPRGTCASTWESGTYKNTTHQPRLEDGAQHKNLRTFSVSTGEELIAFTQKSQEGWDLQYTISESHVIRLVSREVQVFGLAEWVKGAVDKLRVEWASMVSLSPGLNLSVAAFVAEKRGAPASTKIYGLLALSSIPTSLVVTQTEVDNSNTSMHLLSAGGAVVDYRATLDKQGAIHDAAWGPNSSEFGVVYGFMPAKTMLFDQCVTLHDFGSAPHNTISFNPLGRLRFFARFGNLAAKIVAFDRRTLEKVSTIDAPNTCCCSWFPDGRFLLAATLSPRLRVDNGIKIWHASAPLVHVQAVEEPASVLLLVLAAALTSKAAAAKPAGGYHRPGAPRHRARGLATPVISKREGEGGAPRVPESGAVSGSATPSRTGDQGKETEKKEKKKGERGDGSPMGGGSARPSLDIQTNALGETPNSVKDETAAEAAACVPPTPGLEQLGAIAKKLKAIEELKEKAKRGEYLEMTQLKKMEGEVHI